MGAGASTLGEDSSTTLSPPEALARKEAGNRAFEEGRFSEAEDAYTEAIGLANLYSMSPSGKPASPSALSALWSNRSAARQKLNKPGEALADALIAVTMRPRWGKGYYRAGLAAMTLEQWQLAREYLRRALALTPEGSSSHHSISIELEKATSHRPVGIKDGPGSLVTWGLLPSEGCRGGRGGQMMQSSPRVVAGLRGQHMVDVSCGAMHTIAATSTGVYSWGNNTHGQCGIGMSASARGGSGGGVDGDGAAHNISVPQLVPSLIGTKVKAVSCGSGHSCAIDEGGVVWSWGISGQGQLGLGADFASRSVATPTAVLKLHATGHRAIGVSCGIAHTAVLTVTYDKTKGWDMSSPSSFAFGWNRCGQLGLGCDYATVECVHDPTSVLFGDDIIAQQIACGGAHTLVVTQSGRLFATGSGSCGQLGLGSGTRNNLLADGNDPGETSKVNPSTSDALAILSAGKKMMNVHPDVFAYQEVHVGSESHAVAFACAGEEFSCVVTRGTQDVFAFGLNNAGQCGTGHTKNCVVPTLVSDMSGKRVHSLVSGKAVTRALTESGEVWGWGGCGAVCKGEG